jgi:hypothetical protein
VGPLQLWKDLLQQRQPRLQSELVLLLQGVSQDRQAQLLQARPLLRCPQHLGRCKAAFMVLCPDVQLCAAAERDAPLSCAGDEVSLLLVVHQQAQGQPAPDHAAQAAAGAG